jgi:hypothetical protein
MEDCFEGVLNDPMRLSLITAHLCTELLYEMSVVANTKAAYNE